MKRRPCARKIITTLAHRAYRRALLDDEVETLLGFYQQGRGDGDFESGIQQALARILVAPSFLYRVEEEPKGVRPGDTYRISDLELASRLSFFLWSSIPDDELLDVASKGRLRDPDVLGQQVKRMLADARSEALTTNFAGQWLYLRDLANVQTSASNFDDNLRQAFRRETEMLFSTIVREDRSIIDLLNADYTFVDERLARHYGIPNIHGSYFRRIPLDADSPRRGLLGQGSMLTVTSVATRTSPVSRGKWILENILGTPAPVPPPGVEVNLEKDPAEVKVTSLRQRMEAHRANPVCASCHKIMDPIGFALENVRSGRDVARARRRDAGGCVRPARRRNAAARSRRSAAGVAHQVRCVRDDRDRTAADLRAGPAGGVLRHADGAVDRPARGQERLQILVARPRRDRKRAVSDEDEEA